MSSVVPAISWGKLTLLKLVTGLLCRLLKNINRYIVQISCSLINLIFRNIYAVTYDSFRNFIRDFRVKLIFSGFIHRPIE